SGGRLGADRRGRHRRQRGDRRRVSRGTGGLRASAGSGRAGAPGRGDRSRGGRGRGCDAAGRLQQLDGLAGVPPERAGARDHAPPPLRRGRGRASAVIPAGSNPERAASKRRGVSVSAGGEGKSPKKPVGPKVAARYMRELVWPRRGLLGSGLLLIVINRLAGLVLPGSTRYLIDDVVGHRNLALLTPLVA